MNHSHQGTRRPSHTIEHDHDGTDDHVHEIETYELDLVTGFFEEYSERYGPPGPSFIDASADRLLYNP